MNKGRGLFKEVPVSYSLYNYFHNENFSYATHETQRMLNLC